MFKKALCQLFLLAPVVAGAAGFEEVERIDAKGRVHIHLSESIQPSFTVVPLDDDESEAEVEIEAGSLKIENDRWFSRDRVLLKLESSKIKRIKLQGDGEIEVDSSVTSPLSLSLSGNVCVKGTGVENIQSISGQGILNLKAGQEYTSRIDFSGIVRRASVCN